MTDSARSGDLTPRRPRCGSPATRMADSSNTASIVARPVTSTNSSRARSVRSTSFHQRQQPLPVLGQPARQRAPVLAADNLIVLLHGGALQRSFASTRSYEIARGEPPSLQLPTKTGTPPKTGRVFGVICRPLAHTTMLSYLPTFSSHYRNKVVPPGERLPFRRRESICASAAPRPGSHRLFHAGAAESGLSALAAPSMLSRHRRGSRESREERPRRLPLIDQRRGRTDNRWQDDR